MTLRVTKVICPSCEGSGKFMSSPVLRCMWCRGETRLPVEDARRYADNLWMLAGGGFIAGDHDFDHKIQMEKRAEAVYALTGEKAPWLQPQPPSAGAAR
jgi:hypothetical protein